MSDPLDSIDEILLPPALAKRRQGVAQPIALVVVRELESSDLPALVSLDNSAGEIAPAHQLSRVRSTHHMLAQLCAEGKSNVEIGAIAGYSPAYISVLRNDPAFKELLAHYGAIREKLYIDVLERMKFLGLSSLEELQQRMAEEPEKFTRQELMQLADLMLIKPAAAVASAGRAQGSAPTISIKFVTSEPSTAGGPVIEGEPLK